MQGREKARAKARTKATRAWKYQGFTKENHTERNVYCVTLHVHARALEREPSCTRCHFGTATLLFFVGKENAA